ncbi:5825_t:CDS:2 [Entrophospora sp. SA101]|nr:5819_t:CDS:2 [Entrophospora sp. SA101]CAJ0893024.1 5825_t:CDS:2 [Entrophospora sp. SA101]
MLKFRSLFIEGGEFDLIVDCVKDLLNIGLSDAIVELEKGDCRGRDDEDDGNPEGGRNAEVDWNAGADRNAEVDLCIGLDWDMGDVEDK